VSLEKKNGKIRVGIDFRDLTMATPKDEYLMLIEDLLLDVVDGHKIINFMDDNASYNQIFMAKQDIPKTTFKYPE
jgi:hypothetical protein